MNNASIFDIVKGSFADGPGIRTTFYFKGCNLRCKWCHNPESWAPQKQLLFYRDKCVYCGMCAQVCTHSAIEDRTKCIFCGKCVTQCVNKARMLTGDTKTLDELLRIAKEDIPFYGTDGGVTCSGGECLLQIDFLEAFLKVLKEEHIHTAVDTACNVPLEYMQRAAQYTNLFLVDIKCITPELHREYTGVDNTQILENIKWLSQNRIPLWIRVPVIHECNGNMQEMQRIADFVNELQVERVELLPYHAFGVNKGRALGIEMERYSTILAEDLSNYGKLFERIHK